MTKDINTSAEAPNQNEVQEALEKQIEGFWNDFSELLEKHKIAQHVFVFMHPATSKPIFHFNPDEYTAARMTKMCLSELKALVMDNLNA